MRYARCHAKSTLITSLQLGVLVFTALLKSMGLTLLPEGDIQQMIMSALADAEAPVSHMVFAAPTRFSALVGAHGRAKGAWSADKTY